MNRFRPAVLAPYGIPLKVLIPCTSAPRTLPNAVSTTTASPSAAHASRRQMPDAAVSRDACVMKTRRFILGLLPRTLSTTEDTGDKEDQSFLKRFEPLRPPWWRFWTSLL